MTGTELAKQTITARLLLEYADYSLNEIEDKTGIPAIKAGQMLTDLLADRNWLTLRQKEEVLIHRMEDVVRDALDRLDRVGDKEYAATLNAVLRGFETIAKRLDQARKNVDIDITEITRAQARTFGGAYDYAWDAGMELLREKYDISDAEILEAKEAGMKSAREKLKESTSND